MLTMRASDVGVDGEAMVDASYCLVEDTVDAVLMREACDHGGLVEGKGGDASRRIHSEVRHTMRIV